jgi:hypothetical protein
VLCDAKDFGERFLDRRSMVRVERTTSSQNKERDHD